MDLVDLTSPGKSRSMRPQGAGGAVQAAARLAAIALLPFSDLAPHSPADELLSLEQIHLHTDEQQPAERVGGKRRRPQAIDLAGDDSDDEAKRRIMQFARRVNAERGLAGTAPANGQQQQQQPEQQQPHQQQHAVHEGAEAAGAVPPANKLLAALHAERMARQAQRQQQQQHPVAEAGQARPSGSQQGAQPPHEQPQWQARGQAPRQPQQHVQAGAHLSLLSYNVWFREDIHIQARMAATGRVIEARQPDFVCLQVRLGWACDGGQAGAG